MPGGWEPRRVHAPNESAQPCAVNDVMLHRPAGAQLQHAPCSARSAHVPTWGHCRRDFQYDELCIDEDHIDRETHAERVDAAARDEQQAAMLGNVRLT